METINIQLSIEELRIEKDNDRLILHIIGKELNKPENTMENLLPDSKNQKPVILTDFMDDIIMKKKQYNLYRSAESYISTRNSIKKFLNGNNILITDISNSLLEEYQSWMKKQGLTKNTISFYLRTLRTVYKKAVELNITNDQQPFKGVYTGIAKTRKRSIELHDIKAIRHYKTDNLRLAFARDMFLFSFFTQGMSFVDMSYLEKKDVANGHIIYRRKKTGQKIIIKLTEEIEEIIRRNPSNTQKYLLPIIGKENGKERNQKRCRQNEVNNNLKKISEELHLSKPLTMYVARHSWASLAYSNGVSLSTISHALGHDSEKTTLIYLKELDSAAIDIANKTVISLLGKE